MEPRLSLSKWSDCFVGSVLHCLFGFLRNAKMVVLSHNVYNTKVHLHLPNVSVDNPERPTILETCNK